MPIMLSSIVVAAAASTFPQYPSLSPNASHLVYSDRGDLWSVPATGGAATRLTSHPAAELRTAFAPDGSWIAFESDRDGTRNIYRMPVDIRQGALVADGPIERVTTSERWELLSGVTPDGQAVLFHSYREPEIYRQPQMYRAPVDGGPALELQPGDALTKTFSMPVVCWGTSSVHVICGGNPPKIASSQTVQPWGRILTILYPQIS